MSDASAPRSPFGARSLDAGVIGFAIFTLLAHATVWRGGSLEDLCLASAVVLALVAAGALGARLRRPRPARGEAPPAQPVLPDVPDAREAPRLRLALLLAGAAIAVVAGVATGSLTAWWGVAAVTVGAALVGERSLPTDRPAPRPPPRAGADSRALLALLGLVLAVGVSVAHREDADDSFYVNLVVAGIDHPDAPLLADDTLHGYANVPMALPVFRVISWELAQAAIGRTLGVDGIDLAHRIVPPLVALAVPFAWGRLAMRLLPTAWPWVTALLVLGLGLAGDGRAGYADFALLRLHQGKTVLLHVVLPLCAAYGIELGRAPGWPGLVRLAAAQIAAVGLSASGLWLAPTVAMVGLVSALPLAPRALARHGRALAMGAATVVYPLALALALRAATVRAVEQAVKPLTGSSWSAERLMEQATLVVLGDGAYRVVALFALVAVTALPGAPWLRRFAAVSGAAFLLVFFDPWTARGIALGVAGAETYFRVFWLVPLPLFVAALVASPFVVPLPARVSSTAARAGLTGALALVVWGWAPAVHTLSADNGVRLAAPGPKLPPEELAAARIVAAHAGPEAFVLAPLRIARWIPLLQQHPRPLMTREMYLDRLHERLGQAELDRRRALTYAVGGQARPARGPALLAEAIAGDPLQVVCLSGAALGWPELRRVLLDSPLEVVARDADHEIWARPQTGSADRP